MSSEPPGSDPGKPGDANAVNGWYELFSRGSRDWLRHSEKIREAVREHLPQIVAGSDIINDGARTVRVPVRMLEHYRFRLRHDSEAQGVGQGTAKPGDLLGPANAGSKQGGKGAGGTEQGGADLLLEFKVDDIIDWMWEELRLPNLQPRVGQSEEAEWKREGWDRRGARSRLDRRRSVKESVKRRALDSSAPAFIDEDLRYRQLTRRRQPALRAAVFFLLDVSASMTEGDRQLAKTFFFWVAAGLRREYRSLDIVFVAHTTEAWEFSEADFFKVAGSGGTVASAGLNKVQEIIKARFDPGSCNVYLFYASDGDNAVDDREPARAELEGIAKDAQYAGYVEIASGLRSSHSETSKLFDAVSAQGLPSGRCTIRDANDVANAVRHFFTLEAQAAATIDAPGSAP
ncbi:MAG: DUF444 family protein [Steroidobacteraceae bacterium]|jgi:uncharacterized sporulation protein YeaH/YhbH (DUF444 family)